MKAGFSGVRPRFLFALFAAVIWAFFSLRWASEYTNGPKGDACFYTSMTWQFFSPARQSLELSSMHSRRVLGPFLASLALKAEGLEGPPYVWTYRPYSPKPQWEPGKRLAYESILRAWRVIDFLGFIGLAAAAASLMPKALGPGLAILTALNLFLTPSLGLLNILYTQQGNDTLSLLGLAWALVLLIRKKETAAFLLLGLASLGREQALFMLPLLRLFFRFNFPKAAALAALPYLTITFFPRFPDIVPWHDNSSNMDTATTSVFEAYWLILRYEWRFITSLKGLVLPFDVLLNFGTFLALVFASKFRTDWRFLVLAGLCFVFQADRHMVLLTIVGLAALNSLDLSSLGFAPKKARLGLAALLAAKIVLLLAARDSRWLQTESWHRI